MGMSTPEVKILLVLRKLFDESSCFFVGLHKSARIEDVLKVKAQQMERAVQLCRECSEKVRRCRTVQLDGLG